MRKKKILTWIFLTGAVLVFLFPILRLMANSLMGQEELTASYGSVLYGNKGNLEWKLFPLYPTLRAYIQTLR